MVNTDIMQDEQEDIHLMILKCCIINELMLRSRINQARYIYQEFIRNQIDVISAEF